MIISESAVLRYCSCTQRCFRTNACRTRSFIVKACILFLRSDICFCAHSLIVYRESLCILSCVVSPAAVIHSLIVYRESLCVTVIFGVTALAHSAVFFRCDACRAGSFIVKACVYWFCAVIFPCVHSQLDRLS
jgi:hypothetical protein